MSSSQQATAADPNTLLQVIERIEMKLVMANTDQQMELLLKSYLPRLLSLLLFPNDSVRNKIMAVLSHVNKRIKQHHENSMVKLPVESVLALYLQRSDHPMQNFVRNFAIIYVEMGFQRCTGDEKRHLLPVLFDQLSKLIDGEDGTATDTAREMTPQQRMLYQQQMDVVLRLIVNSLPFLQYPQNSKSERQEEQDTDSRRAESPAVNISLDLELQERFGFIEESMEFGKSAARQVLLTFLQDMILLRSNFSISDSSIDIPAGLSIAAIKRILGKESRIDAKDLEQKKHAILDLLIQSNQFRDNEIVPHLIIGVCEGSDAVVAKCESALKKLQNVDYDDVDLLDRLVRLYTGDSKEQRSQATEHIKLKILDIMSKSIAAASFFPKIRDLLMDSLLSDFASRRLRSAGMALFTWIVNTGDMNIMRRHVGEMFDRLLSIVSQLSSSFSTSITRYAVVSSRTSDVSDIKEDFYIALGMLSAKFPEFVREKPHVAKAYFDALQREPPQVRISIQQGLVSLISAYLEPTTELAHMFERLFMEIYEKGHQGHAAMFSVLQSTNRLFRFQHLPSRLLNLLCVDDTVLQVREEAIRGSELEKFLRFRSFGEAAAREEEKLNSYPEFSAMAPHVYRFLHRKHLQQTRGSASTGSTVSPSFPSPKVHEQILQFLQSCFSKSAERGHISERNLAADIHHETIDTESTVTVLETYLYCLESALIHAKASASLLEVASRNLLKLLSLQASHYGPIFALRFGDILIRLLLHSGAGDEFAREQMARLLAVLFLFMTKTQQTDLVTTLRSNLDPKNLSATDTIAHASICTLGNMISLTKKRYSSNHSLTRNDIVQQFSGVVEKIVSLLDSTQKEIIQIACLTAIGEVAKENALSFVGIDVCSREDTADDEQMKRAKMSITKHSIVHLLIDVLNSSRSSPKLKERIITCMGMFALGEYRDSSIMNDMIDAVFKLNTEKNDEVQFTIGEFLSCVTGGNLYCSLYRQEGYAVLYGDELFSENAEVVEARVQEERKIREEFMIQTLKRVIAQGVLSGKRIVRQSASIWLLAISKYCSDSDTLRVYLKDVQQAFSMLLSDTNDVTQEVASMGLACIYEIGDQQSKKDLVNSLMDSLSGKSKDKKNIKMTEESDLLLFPEDVASKGKSGGNIAGTSYKELVDVANDIGKPDMIYNLMAVSNQNAVWNTKRAAAFSAISISNIAGDTSELEKILPQILPKLYRYTFDPNALISRSMNSMWRALVKNTRETVDMYLDSIMKEIVQGLNANLWRVREASCNAVADVFTGRRFVDMEPYLADCFVGSFRIMDDVKETCRQAAVSAVKKLGAFSAKSCNPHYTEPDAVKRALDIVVPLLLEKGIHFPLKEVVHFSLETIHKICQAAGGLIDEHITNIVGTLLEHMSVIEPNMFNYLQLHQERYGFDTEQLEKLRVGIAQTGPIADTISLCSRHVDDKIMETLVPRLIDIVRSGVGVTTRAATARVIMDLAKFQGRHIKKHAPRLLRSIMSAIENSKSPTERAQLASALPYLLQRTSVSRAQKIIEQILDLYIKASEDDQDARHTAGVVVRYLELQTKSTVRRFYELILPVVFLARHDQSKKVSDEWQRVWEESIDSSTKETVRLFVGPIADRSIQCLDESAWIMKRQGARGILEIAKQLKTDLQPEMRQKLVKVLLDNISGRVWDGKEVLLQALGAVVAAFDTGDRLEHEEERHLLSKVLTIVPRETKRKAPKAYKLEAHKCLHVILQLEIMEPLITETYYHETWTGLVEEVNSHWQPLREQQQSESAMDTTDDKQEVSTPTTPTQQHDSRSDVTKQRLQSQMDEQTIAEVLSSMVHLYPATQKEFDPQNALFRSCVQFFLHELVPDQLHTTRELHVLIKCLQLLVKKSKTRQFRSMDSTIVDTVVANLDPTVRHISVRELVFTLLDKELYDVLVNRQPSPEERNSLVTTLMEGISRHVQREPSPSLKELENVMIDRLRHYRL